MYMYKVKYICDDKTISEDLFLTREEANDNALEHIHRDSSNKAKVFRIKVEGI